MKKSAKKSPLERLVEVAEKQALPVKVKPKSRFPEEAITPIIEDSSDQLPIIDLPSGIPIPTMPNSVVIANSSLNLHLNFNVDDKSIDKIIKNSKQAIKGIAAAGAAMLGTAIFLGNSNKKVNKVKIPLIPKVKVPKLNIN